MARLYTNNASTTLASNIASGATSLDVAAGDGALFPTPTGGDTFTVTIEQGSTREIVEVTARSTDTFTVTRAQEGTSASAFTAGATIELRITAASATAWESGGGGDAFTTIAVSGQSNIVADSSTDTLTVAAGTGITLTTDASTDTLTIASPIASWSPIVESGSYIGPVVGGGADTSSYSTGTLWFVPFFVPKDCTLDQLAYTIGTSTATNVRVGLYTRNATTGRPDALVTGSDVEIPVPVTNNALATGTISVALAAGWYWAAITVDGATTLRRTSTGPHVGYLSGYSSTGTQPMMVSHNFTYGALPSTASTVSAINTFPPVVLGRVA